MSMLNNVLPLTIYGRPIHVYKNTAGYVCSGREEEYIRRVARLSKGGNVQTPLKTINASKYNIPRGIARSISYNFSRRMYTEGVLEQMTRMLTNSDENKGIFIINNPPTNTSDLHDLSLMFGLFYTVYAMHNIGLIHGCTHPKFITVSRDMSRKRRTVDYNVNGSIYSVENNGVTLHIDRFTACRDVTTTPMVILEHIHDMPSTNVIEKLKVLDYINLMAVTPIFAEAYSTAYDYIMCTKKRQKPFKLDKIFSVFDDFLI